jgi:hypothetical protein
MSHEDLVEIAHKWLLSQGCGFVIKELKTFAGEIPDGIGFRSDASILVECKASRADFLRDCKKRFRQLPWMGMGEWRFFMAPKGLIQVSELPEGWGLIEVNDKGKARRIAGGPQGNNWYHSKPFTDFNQRGERDMMYSALRRLHLKGALEQIYKN